MNFKSISQSKKDTGLSYLGMVNNSTKHEKAFKYDELVYTLYLAPAKSSGYEVCPMRNKECTALCLNESGMNRMNMNNDMITESRIKKTKLFFEQRQYFMEWMVEEIITAKNKAEKLGFHFSVRLNNTSDITPESFHMDVNGERKNILQLFPDVQFYDYTKVPSRINLTKKYKNYDLTFSFDGSNLETCEKMLSSKVRVAMVFNTLPKKFLSYKVIDGDLYDMRYRDKKNVIVGLKFKKVRNKLTKDNPFVIQ